MTKALVLADISERTKEVRQMVRELEFGNPNSQEQIEKTNLGFKMCRSHRDSHFMRSLLSRFDAYNSRLAGSVQGVKLLSKSHRYIGSSWQSCVLTTARASIQVYPTIR